MEKLTLLSIANKIEVNDMLSARPTMSFGKHICIRPRVLLIVFSQIMCKVRHKLSAQLVSLNVIGTEWANDSNVGHLFGLLVPLAPKAPTR